MAALMALVDECLIVLDNVRVIADACQNPHLIDRVLSLPIFKAVHQPNQLQRIEFAINFPLHFIHRRISAFAQFLLEYEIVNSCGLLQVLISWRRNIGLERLPH